MSSSMCTKAMGLEDVLRELSAPAQDYILCKLGHFYSLGSFRLVCQKFRDFVDSNVRELTLDLAQEHKQLLEARSRPPVLPLCRSLIVNLRNVPGWDAATNVAVLRLFVRSLTQHVRERITKLAVHFHANGIEGAYAAVSGLLSCLPALEEVNIGSPYRTLPAPLQQQLLMDTVATLPCLESLQVPHLRAADHLAAAPLATSSLKRLVLGSHCDTELSEATVRSLSRMEQLVCLKLANCDDGAVPLLLNHLPPRLEKLVLPRFTLALHRGAITAATIDRCSSDSLGDVWAAQLLSCRALGDRLPLLKLKAVTVSGDLHGGVFDALEQLLARSDLVEVTQVELQPEATLDTISGTLQVLGRWPVSFEVITYNHSCDYNLCTLPVPWSRTRYAPLGDGDCARVQEDEDGNRDGVDALLRTALGRFISSTIPGRPTLQPGADGSARGSPVQLSGSGLNTSISGSSSGHGGSGDVDPATGPKVVLLYGSSIAELLTSRSKLQAWLKSAGQGALKIVQQQWRPQHDSLAWRTWCWDESGTYLALPDQQVVMACFPLHTLAAAFAAVAAAATPPAEAVLVPEERYGCEPIDWRQDARDVLMGVTEPVLLARWRECCAEVATPDGVSPGKQGAVFSCLRQLARFSGRLEQLLKRERQLTDY